MTRPIEAQEWDKRKFLSLGPTFRIDTDNPQMGNGGTCSWLMYGATDKDGDKSSLFQTTDGTFHIHSDKKLEIARKDAEIKRLKEGLQKLSPLENQAEITKIQKEIENKEKGVRGNTGPPAMVPNAESGIIRSRSIRPSVEGEYYLLHHDLVNLCTLPFPL